VLLILGLIASVLMGWVLHVGAEIIQPIVIALLLASMLQPVVITLARRGIPPVVTVVVLTGVLFLGLVQVGTLFITNVEAFLTVPVPTKQVDDVGAAAGDAAPDAPPPTIVADDSATESPAGADEGSDPDEAHGAPAQDGEQAARGDGDGAEEQGTPLDPLASSSQREAIEKAGGWSGIRANIRARIEEAEHLPKGLRDYMVQVLEEVKPEVLAEGFALSGFGFVKTLVLVLIYMVFIFAEQAVFRSKILAIAGNRRDDAAEVLSTIGRGIQRYLGIKTVVSFMTGALCYLVLVALDIPYALLFGFLTFLLNYIPTFGSIIAGIFPTITALAVEASWAKALVVVVTYLSVNLTLGSFIEPRILGRELNLSPLVVVISVVVWAGLWGVVGGFLAVPLTAALQICLASNDTTLPIAIMLGSGPPRDKRRARRRDGKRDDGDGAQTEAA
jgi:predicted PurR-regulated permease PerM